VPLREITLTCNPHYRYPDTSRRTRTDEEREALLLADTMREFVSYAVGCMFGRYSLDKPGLILANQGETLQDYLAKIGYQGSLSAEQAEAIAFLPDEDNVIPMLDGEWFPDDVTERFKAFLRVTFGEAHYSENLAFIESALDRDIRGYFLREFTKDHVQTYKKRPIYWCFSSPKGSFNALVYMHRYRADTVSVVLQYLRDFRGKLQAHRAQLQQSQRSASAGKAERTRATKALGDLDKTLAELKSYEDDVLYPLATQQIAIDLDDGVTVNYAKFGEALRKIG
jgi:type II restriction/modification system DNA methylase subunit YeeA